MDMGSNLVSLFGSGVVGVIAAAVISAIANRKKLGADANAGNATASQAYSTIGLDWVKQITTDNERLRRQVDFQTRRMDAMDVREQLLIDWVREIVRMAKANQPPWLIPSEPVLPPKPEMDWGTPHEKRSS